MRFLDLTLSSIEENLALDEALLLEAEAHRSGEVLRVWESPSYCVILGSGGKLKSEVNVSECQADQVAIARRSSGGGTVLLGPGCLLYTLVLDYERDPALSGIASSYWYVLGKVCESLREMEPEAVHAGISDMAAAGRKFSGNSQQRKQRFLLHHGTILYDFDLDRIARYIRTPERQPDYRAGRGHRDFVVNLTARRKELAQALKSAWDAGTTDNSDLQSAVNALVASKYGLPTWVNRR